jgi:hypothetical protein
MHNAGAEVHISSHAVSANLPCVEKHEPVWAATLALLGNLLPSLPHVGFHIMADTVLAGHAPAFGRPVSHVLLQLRTEVAFSSAASCIVIAGVCFVCCSSRQWFCNVSCLIQALIPSPAFRRLLRGLLHASCAVSLLRWHPAGHRLSGE